MEAAVETQMPRLSEPCSSASPLAATRCGPVWMDAADRAALDAAAAASRKRLRDIGISPRDLEMYFRCEIGALRREVSVVASWDADFRLIDCYLAAIGTIDVVFVGNHAMVAPAVNHGAAFVVVAHCHPNGMAVPSDSDVRGVELDMRAFKFANIPLLDSLIVTSAQVASLREMDVPAGLWRRPAAAEVDGPPDQGEQSRNRTAARIAGTPLTPADVLAYAEADRVLNALASAQAPLRAEWIVGEFRNWLRGRDDFSMAGIAIDTAGKGLGCEILLAREAPAGKIFHTACRFALRSYGKRFYFAILSATSEASADLRLQAALIEKGLREFDLELIDIMLVSPTGMRSMRESGELEMAPGAA